MVFSFSADGQQHEPAPRPDEDPDRSTDRHHDAFDLADDRAQYRLPAHVLKSLTPHLANMLVDVDGVPRRLFERHFSSTFYDFTGQSPPPEAELAFASSAALSVECASRALFDLGLRRVGLVTPISATVSRVLLRNGLECVPLDEEHFWMDLDRISEQLRRCDAVFLAVPNNPTGFEPDRAALLDAIGAAVERKLAVVVDFGLRSYSYLHHWDQYGTVATTWPQLDAIFLEDSGKTWPTANLGVGLSCAFGRLREPLRRATHEVLSDVSPFTLRLLASLITTDQSERDATGTPPYALRVVAENRQQLRTLLKGLSIEVDSLVSLVSVEWLRLPEGPAVDTCKWLEERGVSVMPGDPFYWDRSGDDQHVRVALARSPAHFKEAATRLATLLQRRFP